ncbi:MAG: hypothetical protein A3J65_01110 [Candidatus Buchananbacteria bacterium RIFCSPHIGHO2_02_FULL_45_11b]|uniref:Uncharacterized protein n=2 Tax=Candidatus Buchananiibacteriota TaxID=1817903 RepID=A0A1G1Y6Y0_9BACT|nr:MAG: hypothetical protein A2663_00560 [Candidatus Buchananbacteria bacterium RIFCSPHIGHO2_01_FULL_46_12]OGY51510.1 MAG: hypothetical protein A3J65_01110 [Candidatus Buchananbacteria bacterium RIFCSPHIGHO2_02_FULL_45_11b]
MPQVKIKLGAVELVLAGLIYHLLRLKSKVLIYFLFALFANENKSDSKYLRFIAPKAKIRIIRVGQKKAPQNREAQKHSPPP